MFQCGKIFLLFKKRIIVNLKALTLSYNLSFVSQDNLPFPRFAVTDDEKAAIKIMRSAANI